MEKPAAEIAQEIADGITSKLRAEYPWMNVDSIATAARTANDAVLGACHKEQPKMQASKARCSFMSLSPELRNRVYEYAVVDEVITVDSRTVRDGGAWQPSLTRVSRQIRSEALPVYYGMNVFTFDAECEWYHLRTAEEASESAELHEFLNQRYIFKEPTLRSGIQWSKTIGRKNVAMIRRVDVYGIKERREDVNEATERNTVERLRRRGVTAEVDVQFSDIDS